MITGHTGFKGSWLCTLLHWAGAEITGYSLPPDSSPSLYTIASVGKKINCNIGDIRDLENLFAVFTAAQPEYVIHMAAQPLVLDGYARPAYTYDTNVMGTVNILECVRQTSCVKSFLNVTTDKVYFNQEWYWGYREMDPLDGHDPYSNSKSCSELVTGAYKRSFFNEKNLPISTARAGNVIGGGDFAANRIIPDCIRASLEKQPVTLRHPNSIRPYQHVLEPLVMYLELLKKQEEMPQISGAYNIGPDESDCVTTSVLATMFCGAWGDGAYWETVGKSSLHEANFLKLDCSKIKNVLGWSPVWSIETAIEKTVEWTRAYVADADMSSFMIKQISEYMKDKEVS